MSQATSSWFVRLPDGRVVRAASTAVVRHHLSSGRIPIHSTVRRHEEEEWQFLEWTEEFADLAEAANGDAPIEPDEKEDKEERRSRRRRRDKPITVSSRLDPNQLQTIGIGQAIHELTSALDSTLVQRKLVVAVAAGLSMGVLLGFPVVSGFAVGEKSELITRIVVFGGAWLIAAISSAFLTQLTFVEVSRLRPAKWREALDGIGRTTLRIALAHLVIVGAALGLIYLIRQAPGWLNARDELAPVGLRQIFSSWAVILALVLEIGIWPVLGLTLLQAPVLVVEGCSVFRGLRLWLSLIQGDLGRAFLYEALAIGLGLVVAIPLAAPLLGTAHLYNDGSLTIASTFTRIVLGCLVMAPVAAYLIVANLFIYLNLRYEVTGRGK